MGFQQCRIVLAVCSFVLVDAQTPKPCCTPTVFTTGLSTLNQVPAQQGQPAQLVSEEGMFYYDVPNKRTAVNATVQVLYSSQPVQQLYQIQDFGKKMMYVIIDNKICQKTPLPGDFPGTDCIPDDAKFQGSINLGEQFPVNRWLISAANVTQEISMADKCIPVTSVLIVQQNGITVSSQEYYNFKSSIDNPDKIFTPPAICNHAEVVKLGSDDAHYKRPMKKPFML